tara:strand:+ start:82 stop:420 length:339 start_codon:yes stop_codon:yes gene_type:complete
MSEEVTQQEETQQEEEVQTENKDEIVEVPWEEVKSIFEVREALRDVDSRFSQLLLNYEKQKAAFLARSHELETFLYEQGSTLREKMQMDTSLAYELKLPANEGEKAYFLRKD